MAGNLRVTLFMEDGKFGWSETHFVANQALGIEKGQLLMEGLAESRAGLLGTGPKLTFGRISDDTIKRDSLVTIFNLGTGAVNPKLSNSGPSDVPWTTVLLRGEGTSLYRKQIYVSGCPDLDIVDGPPRKIADATLDAAFRQYFLELKTNWGFKVTKRGADAPLINIVSVGAAAPFLVTTAVSHGFKTGDIVRIVGADPSTIRGTWTVTKVSDTSFTLNGSTGTYAYIGQGQVKANDKMIVPYSNVLIRSVVSHRRGRPFDSPRGRRKRRVKA